MSEKRVVHDIDGREVKVGDIVMLPKYSLLSKSYVLGFTAKAIILSCYRDPKHPNQISRSGWRKLDLHNYKQLIQFIPDVYIVETDAEIPEQLKKYAQCKK